MKTKDRKEIFTRTDKELRKNLKEAKDLLFTLSLDHKQNKLKNTRQIFWKRKEIAWILTALKQKELALKEEAK